MLYSNDRRQFLGATALLALVPHFARAASKKAPPRSLFGAKSTAEQVTEGIDLTGKTVVVTGCNSGIGLETMRALALRGAHVIGTARTMEKGKEACASVRGKATPVVLELTDFDSIVACADEIQAMATPIDALVCNAGVLLTELKQVRGLEMQFVVNHLGHFVLVNRLLNRVQEAPEGRVVVVSSVAHRAATNGIEFDNLSGEREFNGFRMYGRSKLANGLFSLELARRLEGTNATSNSLHPGGVATNIVRNIPSMQGASYLTKSPEEGAATSCYVASNPALAGVSGYYFSDCNPEDPGGFMTDEAMAAKLWAVSEELSEGYLT
jgi:NAD(P)-dependent dehydrogenase (short-subunit alcohol dehydrogenase family)